MFTVQDKVIKIISEKVKLSTTVQLKSLLKEDLNIDSLDIIDIILELEDFYNVEILDEELYNIKNVDNIVCLICKKMKRILDSSVR